MKNTIYVGTNVQATVPVGGIIPLTLTQKRFNRCNANSEIDRVASAVSITANGDGCRPRYTVIAKITFASTETGNGIVTLFKNGVAVPLADATASITVADTQYVTVTIPASILTECSGNTDLTLVNTGAIELVVISASMVVTEN
jgi:hypothetical protein